MRLVTFLGILFIAANMGGDFQSPYGLTDFGVAAAIIFFITLDVVELNKKNNE